ncbi:8968_t:CDS:2, partial [Scutellospora calospora]
PLPEGLLFLAFDNEQKGQKNYLDRGFNMAYDSLSKSQFDEIFSVDTQMQEVIDEELHSYLSGILELLSEGKLSSTNAIDSFVASTSTNTAKMKTCLSCNMQNIENRKKICLNCKTQLPTLAEIQKEKVIEIANSLTDQLSSPLIFRSYKTNEEQSVTSVPKISLTQQVTDQRIDIPNIYT